MQRYVDEAVHAQRGYSSLVVWSKTSRLKYSVFVCQSAVILLDGDVNAVIDLWDWSEAQDDKEIKRDDLFRFHGLNLAYLN